MKVWYTSFASMVAYKQLTHFLVRQLLQAPEETTLGGVGSFFAPSTQPSTEPATPDVTVVDDYSPTEQPNEP